MTSGFLLEQMFFWGEKLICLREADGELHFGRAELEMPVKDPTRDVQWAVG